MQQKWKLTRENLSEIREEVKNFYSGQRQMRRRYDTVPYCWRK